MKSLVIVESPAKARTLKKILGEGFSVKASVGHVMDLPAKELGVDVDRDFAPAYGVIPGKEKILKELRQAAKTAERIYLAPDPDREGEAIAYHIATALGKKGKEMFRVTFNEITERAVKEAIGNPGRVDMNKVEAQQARRVLDRLVGYKLSPLLWKKISRGLSAGRVQSVALRIAVERERQIEAFKKEEYWSIEALLEGSQTGGDGPPRQGSQTPSNGPEFRAKLYSYKGSLVIDRDATEGKRFLITNEDAALKTADTLRTAELFVSKVDKKLRKRMPSAPFTTSTLQQEASSKLGFTAKRTMLIAQQLYEGIELGEEGSYGLITYMRTDSVKLSAEARKWAKEFIKKNYGADYLPLKPPVYKSKASAQEAHEAVRPTSPSMSPEQVKSFLSRDHYRLYSLIWQRFLASQMRPAEFEQTTFEISVKEISEKEYGPALFRASGSVPKFPGFMVLYKGPVKEEEEEEEGLLPPLEEGEKLNIKGIEPKQHFTQPPPRYSEASLVMTLEEKGIGRPSTYAAILSTIVDRKYVLKENGRFKPTELGALVNDYLVKGFPKLMNIGFTAKMEDELDRIEEGRLGWVKVVKDFYKPFSLNLTKAAQTTDKVKPEDVPTEEVCEECSSPMVIRWGRHGRFMACSGYPKCKNTRPLEGEKQEAEARQTDETCEKCSAPMLLKSGRFGKFLACSNYPKCKSTRPIPTGVKCPEDGGDIIERRTKRGGKPFWSCRNYPECKFAMWNRPVPEKCPNCGAEFLLIKKDKSGTLVRACHAKECGFKEEVKEG